QVTIRGAKASGTADGADGQNPPFDHLVRRHFILRGQERLIHSFTGRQGKRLQPPVKLLAAGGTKYLFCLPFAQPISFFASTRLWQNRKSRQFDLDWPNAPFLDHYS